MKKIYVIVLLALSYAAYSKSRPADYTILESKEDKTLKKNEAVFLITFFNKEKIINREITFSYNGKNKKQKLDSTGKILLKVVPGKYLFNFFYDINHEEITTDSIIIKSKHKTQLQINFRTSQFQAPAKKPVVYVYPKQKENVSIKLDLKGEFEFSYPEYLNGWNFIGNPDGSIEMNNKKYHYLFWDGKLNIETEKLNFNEGFIVNKKNLVDFFETKLTKMGLNSIEIEDYITYWCPIMMANENNYIHFMFNEDYNQYASISVNPKPDKIFRVFMLWRKSENQAVSNLIDQKLESFTRSGFTIVEWGGAEIESLPLIAN